MEILRIKYAEIENQDVSGAFILYDEVHFLISEKQASALKKVWDRQAAYIKSVHNRSHYLVRCCWGIKWVISQMLIDSRYLPLRHLTELYFSGNERLASVEFKLCGGDVVVIFRKRGLAKN